MGIFPVTSHIFNGNRDKCSERSLLRAPYHLQQVLFAKDLLNVVVIRETISASFVDKVNLETIFVQKATQGFVRVKVVHKA